MDEADGIARVARPSLAAQRRPCLALDDRPIAVRWLPAKRDRRPAPSVTGNAVIEQDLLASRRALQGKMSCERAATQALIDNLVQRDHSRLTFDLSGPP